MPPKREGRQEGQTILMPADYDLRSPMKNFVCIFYFRRWLVALPPPPPLPPPPAPTGVGHSRATLERCAEPFGIANDFGEEGGPCLVDTASGARTAVPYRVLLVCCCCSDVLDHIFREVFSLFAALGIDDGAK